MSFIIISLGRHAACSKYYKSYTRCIQIKPLPPVFSLDDIILNELATVHLDGYLVDFAFRLNMSVHELHVCVCIYFRGFKPTGEYLNILNGESFIYTGFNIVLYYICLEAVYHPDIRTLQA